MNRIGIVLVAICSILGVMIPFGVSQTNDPISISTPTGTEVYNPGETCVIRWSLGWDNDPIPVDIYLCKGDAVLGYIVLDLQHSFAYPWVVPSLEDGDNYQVLVIASGDELNYDLSNPFTIKTPQSITITFPTGQEKLETQYTYTITWKTTGLIEEVNIFLINDNFSPKTLVSGTSNDCSYRWTLSNSLSESNRYRIMIENSDNSLVLDVSGYFSISHSRDDGGDGDENDNNGDSNNNDTLPNSSVPGFDLFLIFSCMVLVFATIIIKRRRIFVV